MTTVGTKREWFSEADEQQRGALFVGSDADCSWDGESTSSAFLSAAAIADYAAAHAVP